MIGIGVSVPHPIRYDTYNDPVTQCFISTIVTQLYPKGKFGIFACLRSGVRLFLSWNIKN